MPAANYIELIDSALELTPYSANTALQANKDVSSIQLHAPQFVIYERRFTMTHLPKDKSVLRTDIAAKIDIETPLGYPSFFMIYVEHTDTHRRDYPIIRSGHPRITNLRMSLAGKEVPVLKAFSQKELDYITLKNCHRNSNYAEARYIDPLVLLDLESLGLGVEPDGYPVRKRLECSVELTALELPGLFNSLYSSHLEWAGNAEYTQNYVFKCILIYENRVVEGSTNQMKINWKY